MAVRITEDSPLDEKQEIFVREYMKNLRPTAAARIAYPESVNPREKGKYLLSRPHVKKAIADAKIDLQNNGKYGLKQAVEEFDVAIRFAFTTKNANALAKLLETKAKLHGLLIDRREISIVPFQINISGITREALPRPAAPIEIEAKEVKELAKESEDHGGSGEPVNSQPEPEDDRISSCGPGDEGIPGIERVCPGPDGADRIWEVDFMRHRDPISIDGAAEVSGRDSADAVGGDSELLSGIEIDDSEDLG